jgi:hypothetical protein
MGESVVEVPQLAAAHPSHVRVDPETGAVRVLGHVVAQNRVVNAPVTFG